MKYLQPRYYPVIIVILCILSRLPQLISPYLILDGDECVLGCMAKAMYEGRDFSLFFWGQQYGFSLIESLAILPFQAILGMGTIPVKLAMLCLWTTGVVFLYKTFLAVNNKNYTQALLLTLAFIFNPAWAIWSMKARGGYLTSFLLSSFILYLLFNDRVNKKMRTWLTIGVLLNFVYQSQPFWLIGLTPLIVYSLATHRNLKGLFAVSIPLLILLPLFHVYKSKLPLGYYPIVYISPTSENIGFYIRRVPEFLYFSLHGNYYFSYPQPPNFFQAFVAIIFITLIFLLLLLGLYHILLKRRGYGLFICAVIFIPAFLGLSIFARTAEGRYLLPLTGFSLLALQFYLNKVKTGKLFNTGMMTVIAAGVVAVITFWNFKFSPGTKKSFLQTLRYLENNGVHYTYCTHTMLNWQIVYYSNENIISRIIYLPGRWPQHQHAADSALDNGARLAIVGYAEHIADAHAKNIQIVNEYFVGLNPTKEELVQSAFEFRENK